MSIKALLFGSIGVLAETSDMQRRAYNQAFEEMAINWHWDPETYRYLLQFVGGQARMRLLSSATGQNLTDDVIAKVHARKTDIAGKIVAGEVTALRPGVREVIAAAKTAGIPMAIVTSTQRANIDAIANAAGIDLSDFAVIVTNADVLDSKPDPSPYQFALDALGVAARDALAIEDTAASLASAVSAAIPTIATPGAYAKGQDFRLATAVVDQLQDETGDLAAPIAEAIKVASPA